jgi:hypothetical protein
MHKGDSEWWDGRSQAITLSKVGTARDNASGTLLQIAPTAKAGSGVHVDDRPRGARPSPEKRAGLQHADYGRVAVMGFDKDRLVLIS